MARISTAHSATTRRSRKNGHRAHPAENQLPGEALLGFGDGYVEIEDVKAAGGFACGVASNEKTRQGVDEWKRQRLIRAGRILLSRITVPLTNWKRFCLKRRRSDMPFEQFDRSRLMLLPLSERVHDLDLSVMVNPEEKPEYHHDTITLLAQRVRAARERKRADDDGRACGARRRGAPASFAWLKRAISPICFQRRHRHPRF